jgi:hypothetical protein
MSKRSAASRSERTTNNVIPLPKVRVESKAVAAGPGELDLLLDGRRIIVEAQRELVLRCGKASITLTRAGKIILRGTHVVSKSSGANAVQGTQVRIN